MKKKIYIIIAIILAVLFGAIIYTSFQSKYNEIIFLVRHISLFTLLALIALIVILYFYKFVIKKVDSNKHINYIRIFTALVFIGVLSLGSAIQLKYIERYDSPILSSCSYYDEYGNILYHNHLPMSCEEPVVTQNGNETILLFEEQYDGPFEQFWVDEQLFQNGTIEINLYVTVKVVHIDNKLTYYSINWMEFAEITVDNTIYYGYITREKIVENTYLEKTFISNQKGYNFQDVNNNVFYPFSSYRDFDSSEQVFEIEYQMFYTEQYGTNSDIKEFRIDKIDLLNAPDETEHIARGLRKETEEGEFIQISKINSGFTELGVMRYVFNEDSSRFILGPNNGGATTTIFTADIIKEYGYKDNNLIINSFETPASPFTLDVYSSLNNDSINVEVPKLESYQKIFRTEYGYLQENYVDGITETDLLIHLTQNSLSDMSYYSYNNDMEFLNYENLIFEPWPELYVIDHYRPIFDFE